MPEAPDPGRPPVRRTRVPSFDLYGEARARAHLDPVHVEPLVTRSSRHDWKIRPHRHRGLLQVFWVRQGGGVLLDGAEERALTAPLVMIIPPGAVHGFRFTPGSDGHVLTLTEGFLAQCRRLAGEALLPGALSQLPLAREAALAEELNASFIRLERAFRGLGPEREAALAGHALLLLALLRQGREAEANAWPGAAQAMLVRRFREDIEHHYMDHADLETHCRRLGVTQSSLTRACRRITGRSPLDIIHERLMAEARRMLIHGSRNVSGVAHALGFEPAYFSRFFARREGIPPAAYQRRHGG